MAANIAFSQRRNNVCVLAEYCSLRSLLRAAVLRGCINMSYRVRGKDKNEKENRERVKMRKGIEEG